MSTYSEIRLHVRDVTHKSTTALPDSLFETWEPIVRTRLLTDLHPREQVTTSTVTPAANPFTIATDALEVLQLSYDDGNYERIIIRTSREQATQWQGRR